MKVILIKVKKMKSKIFIKNLVSNIPYSIGYIFTHIPYAWRLGREYTNFKNNIKLFENMSEDEKVSYEIKKLNIINTYAPKKFDFYKETYKKYGVLGKKIKTLDDFIAYPIITKDMIRKYSDDFKGYMKTNTGGTSGEPFSFYLDKDAFAREWAHMHYIWSLKDYKQTDIKITLRGKNLGDKNIIYNPVHNEFIITTYKKVESFKNELISLFIKHDIKYVHGYPSAVYEFFKELEKILNDQEKRLITKNIVSCFLGSEFPVSYIVEYLQKNWNLDYISWYGLSEMAILAYDENKNNQYKPFMTYGYAEIENNRLLGTSFNNFDMPLIRYDTGDLVEGKIDKNGLLEYFSITEGREGDYIIDTNDKKIPLTSLIFGRHHKIFDIADFLQVKQEVDGEVKFYITIKDKDSLDLHCLENYFDLTNVDIRYSFELLESPIRTKIGKIKLKI